MKFPVAFLFVIFAWSSWIDINGLWVELPLIVYRLPESWTLPSYLAVIMQCANIGPIIYTIVLYVLKKKHSNKRTAGQNLETGMIIAIISVGIGATLALSLTWHITAIIGGKEHSVVLIALAFCLAAVDTTSSITFLPFLAHFKPSYMTAFYVGEGMSGLLPTAIAFIQGSGEYTCASTAVNGTDNSTASTLTPHYSDLLFSVRDFFLILFAMLLLSLIAFIVLRFSDYCKEERVNIEEPATLLVRYEKKDTPIEEVNGSDFNSSTQIVKEETPAQEPLTNTQYYSMLVIMAVVSGLNFGVLPSIQIYSLLPYGQLYYSLGVKLSTLANPLACFLGFCLMPQSFVVIGVLTCISLASAVYVIVVATYSPFPPVEGVAAAVAMVIVWVIFTGCTSYLRMLISRVAMRKGHSALFWLGICTQIGSFIGAVVTFLSTTVFSLLQSAPQC